MDPDQVAKAFVEHYYSTFDANRAGLANLYQDGSMLTFEGQKTQGSQNIVAKLIALPFQQCKHLITTVDCQPSGPAGGMLVFVSGNLQLAGEQHALKFSQILLSTAAVSFYYLSMWVVSTLNHPSKAIVSMFNYHGG
nr:nuclear transport factor 2A isoform X1 [Populus alba]